MKKLLCAAAVSALVAGCCGEGPATSKHSGKKYYLQYVHKDLGKRSCISKITDAQDISSEEGFNIALKKLLHLAQKYMSEGERNNG